jgi:hypothetical protein
MPLALLPTRLDAAVLACALLGCAVLSAQVITVDTSRMGVTTTPAGAPVDRQYQQIQPTHIELPSTLMSEKSRLDILRTMQSEQGFAMRPLPKGHKGLTLVANGNLDPAGEAYVNMVTSQGMSSKPGDRVVITSVKVDREKIVLELNGGPDPKHRFLQHISIGVGAGNDNPIVAAAEPASGSRITLAFKEQVPEITGAQVKQLLAPLISFDVKTPVQAYTDTLPKPLKDAILSHQALVGMNTDMILFSLGQPKSKQHEMDGQMPIDIWIYGASPDPVTFVHINGNRVMKVEVARNGKPLQAFTEDVVTPMLQADGRATEEQGPKVKVVMAGDVQRDPNRQAPAPPPTLGPPTDSPSPAADPDAQVMKPVHFPARRPDTQPGSNPDDQEPAAEPAPAQGQGTAPAPAPGPKF